MAEMGEKRVVVVVDAQDSRLPDLIRIRNRRKRYLDLHPQYFGSDLELAGVLLIGYESLTSRC